MVMLPFRDKTPVRRAISTVVSRYGDHKPDLRIDFLQHCAYCHSYDEFVFTYFEVDHFVPKSFFLPLGTITLTQYSNLVYSCKSCNNKKRDKWPSADETVYNDGTCGFVDPCTDEYATHFYRTSYGAIMWCTELGKWMHTTAFKFDEREKMLVLIYNLEKLEKSIHQITNLMEKMDLGSDDYQLVKGKRDHYLLTYFKFDCERRKTIHY